MTFQIILPLAGLGKQKGLPGEGDHGAKSGRKKKSFPSHEHDEAWDWGNDWGATLYFLINGRLNLKNSTESMKNLVCHSKEFRLQPGQQKDSNSKTHRSWGAQTNKTDLGDPQIRLESAFPACANSLYSASAFWGQAGTQNHCGLIFDSPKKTEIHMLV